MCLTKQVVTPRVPHTRTWMDALSDEILDESDAKSVTRHTLRCFCEALRGARAPIAMSRAAGEPPADALQAARPGDEAIGLYMKQEMAQSREPR